MPDVRAAKCGCHQSNSACSQPKSGYINTLNKQREIQNPPLPPVHPAASDAAAPPRSFVSGVKNLPDFEKAWELYPKKEAKGLARTAWLRLQREGLLPPVAQIESAIRHFMGTESWQREQGRFVPQMSNWLKGQRWQDDAVTGGHSRDRTQKIRSQCCSGHDAKGRCRQCRTSQRARSSQATL